MENPNTLVVYYSKTGNTETVAKAVVEKLGCDFDKIEFDEKGKTISSTKDPSAYERVILMAPIWAFSLADPMKLYLKEHSGIKNYSLIVTCGGLGLKGCVKNCKSALGAAPTQAMKIRARTIKDGSFDISSIN